MRTATRPSCWTLNSNLRKTEIMKKIYIAIAVLSTAVLAGCQQEKPINDAPLGENDIVFSIGNGIATRSDESVPVVRKGVVIPLESEEMQQAFLLEETVVNLDELSAVPETKGTPAYTENLGVLYANNLAVYGDKGGFTTETTYSNMDDKIVAEKGWRYQYSYATDPWPGDEAVNLYFRMPATQNGVTISDRSNGAFTFSYTSPGTAKQQQDILFAYRSLTKKQNKSYIPDGAPILFNHALTGVKFAIGNEADELEQIAITKIVVSGLIKSGSCVITPVSENEYADEREVYTSADAAKWTLGTERGSFSSETIEGTVEYKKGGSFGNKGKYPDSFVPDKINNDKANTQNLNDAEGSQTFWFIPQTITNDVQLTISFTTDGGKTSNDWTITDFGKVLNGVKWDAGELRTYTIKVDNVNVKIEDNVTIAGTSTNGYTGSVKKDVVITNTGNTDAYIRAALVGQWLDSNENPVFGFTDEVFALKKVASWYEDQFINTEHKQGTFTGLVGYNGAASSFWEKGKDGYYYFVHVVPADNGTIPGAYKTVSGGEATEVTGPSAPLFTSYTVGEAPTSEIAGLGVTIHFELEIATQAVSAKNTDTSYLTWKEAWTKALGYDPTTTDPTIKQ